MSHITPSAMPRLERCIGGAVLPNADEEFDSAMKGKALHDFMRRLALGESRASALAEMPAEFAKDAECIDIPEVISHGAPEVGMALNLASGTARALGENMTREDVRAARRADEMGMLLDWVAIQGDVVRVTDHKFGWQEDLGPASDHLQLLVYTATALIALDKEEARGELWHWDGTRWRVDGVTMDWLGAQEVLERVRALLAKRDAAAEALARGEMPRLSLGKWCAWCPAQRFCPAKRSALEAVLHDAVVTFSAEQAGAAYVRLKQVRSDVERMLSDLEELAGQTPLPLPDGTVLRQQEREVTRIDPAAAEDWLRKTFGDAAAGAAVETRVAMTWEGLKDSLRQHVLPVLQQAHAEGRLQGRKPSLAALVQQARTGLAAVGAVQVSTYVTTKAGRPPQPVLSVDDVEDSALPDKEEV